MAWTKLHGSHSQSYTFSEEQFILDLKKTAKAIGAPYSEEATKTILRAYGDNFRAGAVLWRATNRPGDIVNYRFYERKPFDTVTIAVQNGFLKPDNHLAQLITHWSALYDGTPEQSCDFDSDTGLSKAWVYLGGMRPLDDILGIPDLPEHIRARKPLFEKLGLNLVRHIAVDYRKNTLNLYFRAQGPATPEQITEFTDLAGATHPEPELLKEMLRLLSPSGYTFSVTLKDDTGEIERVGFYALKLPTGVIPEVGERLKTFFEMAPSYDDEEMNAVAWSFGKGGKTYIKAERSYCGHLVELMKTWKSTFSS
ncbi:prenyltransferase-like protein [Calycina marina]|uniref:Aromatic prenyltransferase n=1 Tax=Calycina marina TaxID=1763456 RepID=A0A9P7Z4U8_9HELO|nr:prenyltransferase-like protein [Calycina marina]